MNWIKIRESNAFRTMGDTKSSIETIGTNCGLIPSINWGEVQEKRVKRGEWKVRDTMLDILDSIIKDSSNYCLWMYDIRRGAVISCTEKNILDFLKLYFRDKYALKQSGIREFQITIVPGYYYTIKVHYIKRPNAKCPLTHALNVTHNDHYSGSGITMIVSDLSIVDIVRSYFNLVCESDGCKNKASDVCGKCKSVSYCSVECQTKHWANSHKAVCKSIKCSREESRKKIDELTKKVLEDYDKVII